MIGRVALVASFAVVFAPAIARAQASDASAPDHASDRIGRVHRSGAAQRCWNAFLHANPETGSVRLRVRVEVAASGSVEHVTFLEPAPEPLTQCVRAEIRRLTFEAGAANTFETTYSFAAGTPAPIPAEH